MIAIKEYITGYFNTNPTRGRFFKVLERLTHGTSLLLADLDIISNQIIETRKMKKKVFSIACLNNLNK